MPSQRVVLFTSRKMNPGLYTVLLPPPQTNLDLPDADDEPFLAVALAAGADFLVTGNLSDYPPDKRRGCEVVSPAVFMEHWRKLQDED